MIYNLYIFNRKGSCLYYKEWNRSFNSLKDDVEEERRLMFGMLFSIKELITKMSPNKREPIHCFKTNKFTLHLFETASGLRFVLNTDNDTGDLQPNLRYIYSELYVEFVTKNPLYDPKSNEMIKSPAFELNLEKYLQSLLCFK